MENVKSKFNKGDIVLVSRHLTGLYRGAEEKLFEKLLNKNTEITKKHFTNGHWYYQIRIDGEQSWYSEDIINFPIVVQMINSLGENTNDI
jgi:hypothetical protein